MTMTSENLTQAAGIGNLKRAIEREEQLRKEQIERVWKDTQSSLRYACAIGALIAFVLLSGLLIHGARLRVLEHKVLPVISTVVTCGDNSATYTDSSLAREAIDRCFDQN